MSNCVAVASPSALALNAAALARYRERLQRLCARVERSARAVGGSYVPITAAAPDAMFRSDLLAAGLVEPQ